jgi:capsular exopolysaccharide synthesis family protein
MSRIQDILAKAERDGTTRRAQTGPVAAPSPKPLAAVDGSSALDTGSFMPPMSSKGAPAAAMTDARVTAVQETRTATPTLHPALVSAINPHSAAAEQYRAIRARLAHRDDHLPMRTVMVTSPGAGDGKSVTAANLALAMAQEIQRNVVLVDADLRAPSAHVLLGISGTPGLAEVLAGQATLDEALVYVPELHLTLLPAGATPPFPTELLGSNAMRRTLDALRTRFDRIVLDVPAVAPLADAGTVAPMADGVVMVVRAGVTKRPALDQALGAFEPNQVAGIVLNEAH